MANLYDVAEFFTALEKQLPQAVSDLAVQVAISIVDDLALITPVDKGDAMSNWQVTLDEPADEPIPAYNPSAPGVWHGERWIHSVDPDTTRLANYQPTLDAAAFTLADKRPGQDIYITNVVGTDKEPQSYIVELDQGSSPQFVGDFLGRESLVVDDVLSRATLTIK